MGVGAILYVLESGIIYEYCGWITNHFGDEDDRVDGDGVELRGVEAQEPEEAVEERGGLLQVRVLLVVALSERSAEQGRHPLGRIQTHETPGRLPVRYHVCSTRVLQDGGGVFLCRARIQTQPPFGHYSCNNNLNV